jgi:DNA-binding response OmpR family regulator
VLEKTGANVMCCSASEALKLIESEPVDLVVLCHTLIEAEAEMIAERARKRSNGPKLLFVLSHTDEEQYRDTKFDAMSLPDPERLVARATELLQELPDVSPREIKHQTLQVL